jgi:hypothetical protein
MRKEMLTTIVKQEQQQNAGLSAMMHASNVNIISHLNDVLNDGSQRENEAQSMHDW